MVRLDESQEFLNDGETHDSRVKTLLQGIKNNGIDDEGNNGGGLPTENPDAEVDSPVSAFNFNLMNPGRIFTMAGQEYRYLEEMPGGHHMIIRNNPIDHISFNDQVTFRTTWHGELHQDVRDIVAPVVNSFAVGELVLGEIGWSPVLGFDDRWLPSNNWLDYIAGSPMAETATSDMTKVVPTGTRRAFALSFVDVVRLSQNGSFTNLADRGTSHEMVWWLRTPAGENWAGLGREGWGINAGGSRGELEVFSSDTLSTGLGVRPALILHQPAD